MTDDQITEILSRHPLSGEDDLLLVHRDADKTCVGWYAGPDATQHRCDALVQLQIERETTYLLFIQVDERLRGQGHGIALYGLVEEIARAAGCRRVEMFCSGGTHTYEDRDDWMVRRLGYTRVPGPWDGTVEKQLNEEQHEQDRPQEAHQRH